MKQHDSWGSNFLNKQMCQRLGLLLWFIQQSEQPSTTVPAHTARVSHSTFSSKFMFYPNPWDKAEVVSFIWSRREISASSVLTSTITFCREQGFCHNQILRLRNNLSHFSTVLAAEPRVKKSGPFPKAAPCHLHPNKFVCISFYLCGQFCQWSCCNFGVEICLINKLKSNLLCLISHTGVHDLSESKFPLGISCKPLERGAVAHRSFHGLGGSLLTPPTTRGVKALSLQLTGLQIHWEANITQAAEWRQIFKQHPLSSALELDPATTKLSSISRTSHSQMNFLVRKWFHHWNQTKNLFSSSLLLLPGQQPQQGKHPQSTELSESFHGRNCLGQGKSSEIQERFITQTTTHQCLHRLSRSGNKPSPLTQVLCFSL